jgi:hypothetical protein
MTLRATDPGNLWHRMSSPLDERLAMNYIN